jgi:hypothetical protein
VVGAAMEAMCSLVEAVESSGMQKFFLGGVVDQILCEPNPKSAIIKVIIHSNLVV